MLVAIFSLGHMNGMSVLERIFMTYDRKYNDTMGQVLGQIVQILSGLLRVSRFIKADMSGTSAQFVRETIAKNKVVIFSKSYCPYCTMAKEQFQKLNFPFFTVELNNRDDCNQIQAVLGELTGATTVPRVFVDGNFIGGGTDVKKLNETGELKKMLN